MDRLGLFFSGCSYQNFIRCVTHPISSLFRNQVPNKGICIPCRNFILQRSPLTLAPVLLISAIALSILIGGSIALARFLTKPKEEALDMEDIGIWDVEELEETKNLELKENVKTLESNLNALMSQDNSPFTQILKTLESLEEIYSKVNSTDKLAEIKQLKIKCKILIKIQNKDCGPSEVLPYFKGDEDKGIMSDLEFYDVALTEFVKNNGEFSPLAAFQLYEFYTYQASIVTSVSKKLTCLKNANEQLSWAATREQPNALEQVIENCLNINEIDSACTQINTLIGVYKGQGNESKVIQWTTELSRLESLTRNVKN